MEKINNIAPTNVAVSNNKQALTTQSHLLNEPIQDSVEFSTKKKDKQSTAKWFLGAAVALTGIIIALRVNKSINVKRATAEASKQIGTSNPEERTLSVELEKIEKKFNEENEEYMNKHKEYVRKMEEDTSKILDETNKLKENNRKVVEAEEKIINDFKNNFRNTLENKSLEDLKKDINMEKKNIINFDKPFAVVEEHFNGWIVDYSENILTNMYSYVKKQHSNIKDPLDAEKNRQCGVFLLSRLRALVLNGHGNPIAAVEKMGIITKEINKEVDELLTYYFGKNGIKSKKSTDFEIPLEIKNKIKESCKITGSFDSPTQMFSMRLNDAAKSCLEEILVKHVKNNTISEEGKKLISVAEGLNRVATEINTNLKTEAEEVKLSLGSVDRTINNYKKGKFESGREEFWNEFFNEKRTNNKSEDSNEYQRKSEDHKGNHKTYNDTDVEKASIKIFKELGEDLGDVNSLTEGKLIKAYRKLSMKYHPDRNPDNENATKTMQSINYAMEELRTKLGKK